VLWNLPELWTHCPRRIQASNAPTSSLETTERFPRLPQFYRRARDGSFPRVAHMTAHDTLATPLVPGWSVTLARLFR